MSNGHVPVSSLISEAGRGLESEFGSHLHIVIMLLGIVLPTRFPVAVSVWTVDEAGCERSAARSARAGGRLGEVTFCS